MEMAGEIFEKLQLEPPTIGCQRVGLMPDICNKGF